ncbi:MAG TPA: hypothetical protein VFA05_06700 [Gaiellaceae bacterium]|nr:hypothetical protein [Gaiellaceae bacterium]
MSVAERRLLAREATVSAVVAAVLAGVLVWAGPPGVDLAAHAYQRTFLLQHGFTVWNNFWYAGRYSFVTYSLLYYPLAAYLGIKVLAVATVSAAALAFTLVVWREWGPAARFSSRTFAVLWAGVVLSAAFPFALGAALALLALSALQQERRRLFAALTFLTLLASPLAFLFMVVVLAGGVLVQRPRRATVAVIAAAGALELVLRRLFPGEGQFPFHLTDLWPGVLFGVFGIAATWGEPRARRLLGLFVAFLLTSLIAFVVPSDLGGNVERLKFAAIPLALLVVAAVPRRVVLVLPLVFVAGFWNLTALAHTASTAGSDPARSAAYWQGTIRYLHSHLSPSFRVEAVDTSEHWAAAYLPDAGIPIVRGWYRQNDFPQNAILYDPHITGTAYRAWLRSLGVRYVVLSDAPPDYSSRLERKLILSGRSGLRLVWRDAHVRIFELPHASPIVTGRADGTVEWMTPTRLVLFVQRPGVYDVKVRWSPYWRASEGCVARASGGNVVMRTFHSGFVTLSFDVGVRSGLETLTGLAPTRACTS